MQLERYKKTLFARRARTRKSYTLDFQNFIHVMFHFIILSYITFQSVKKRNSQNSLSRNQKEFQNKLFKIFQFSIRLVISYIIPNRQTLNLNSSRHTMIVDSYPFLRETFPFSLSQKKKERKEKKERRKRKRNTVKRPKRTKVTSETAKRGSA